MGSVVLELKQRSGRKRGRVDGVRLSLSLGSRARVSLWLMAVRIKTL
jgi:hypothetical protein